MNNKSDLLSAILLIGLLQIPLYSQPDSETEKKLRSAADAILKNSVFRFADQNNKIYSAAQKIPPEAELKPVSPYNDWRYWNGVLNISMLKLGEVLDEPAYKKFASENVSFGFNNYRYFEEKYKDENKWNYPFGQFFILEELDDGGAMGASVIDVYQMDPQERYKAYIEKVAGHVMNKQARLEDGTLVRSFPHQYTLWADDLYMGLSFISRMGELSGDAKYFDDAVRQVINFNKYLFDEEKGIMYHCWYSDLNCNGVAFWGRANGWALVAQADLLDYLPLDHPQRDTLISLLRRHITGITRYQGENGLWHQLLDKTDSYFETSCSAMFTYAIARAINKGYIDKRYFSVAERGWEGVMSKIRDDGQVDGVCTGTAIQNDLVHYYKRPAPLNDVHGLGTILLAGAEIILLKKEADD